MASGPAVAALKPANDQTGDRSPATGEQPAISAQQTQVIVDANTRSSQELSELVVTSLQVNSKTSLGRERADLAEEGRSKGQQNSVKSVKRDKRAQSKRVLDPSGALYHNWSMVVSLAFLYNFWSLSYRFAFREIDFDTMALWFTLDYSADFVYMLDIIVNLHTGYLEDGVLERNLDKIGQHYRECTIFYLDCLCLLPLDVLYLSIGFNSILRCTRLVKIYKFWSYVDRTERHTNYPNVFRTFTLVHYILVIFHWNACLFHMISKNKIIDIENLYKILDNRCDDILCQYLHAFYWSTLALTTIGDLPRPRTKGEYLYVTVELFFGLFLFASVLGHVANIVTNVSAARKEFQAKLDAVKTFMRMRRVSDELQNKVIRWFDYLWISQKSSDEERTVACLPDRLKAEIAIHVHLDTLKRVDIFQNTEAGFLCELVLRLKPVLFSPGDYVCRKNEVGHEMYIVSRGILEVVTDEGKTVVATLKAGSYFGEISVLNVGLAGNKRTASVRSVGYSDLFCLIKQDLWDVLKNYPNAEMRIRARAEERLSKLDINQTKKLAPNERLAHSEPPLICSNGAHRARVCSTGSRHKRCYLNQMPAACCSSSVAGRANSRRADEDEDDNFSGLRATCCEPISHSKRAAKMTNKRTETRLCRLGSVKSATCNQYLQHSPLFVSCSRSFDDRPGNRSGTLASKGTGLELATAMGRGRKTREAFGYERGDDGQDSSAGFSTEGECRPTQGPSIDDDDDNRSFPNKRKRGSDETRAIESTRLTTKVEPPLGAASGRSCAAVSGPASDGQERVNLDISRPGQKTAAADDEQLHTSSNNSDSNHPNLQPTQSQGSSIAATANSGQSTDGNLKYIPSRVSGSSVGSSQQFAGTISEKSLRLEDQRATSSTLRADEQQQHRRRLQAFQHRHHRHHECHRSPYCESEDGHYSESQATWTMEADTIHAPEADLTRRPSRRARQCRHQNQSQNQYRYLQRHHRPGCSHSRSYSFYYGDDSMRDYNGKVTANSSSSSQLPRPQAGGIGVASDELRCQPTGYWLQTAGNQPPGGLPIIQLPIMTTGAAAQRCANIIATGYAPDYGTHTLQPTAMLAGQMQSASLTHLNVQPISATFATSSAHHRLDNRQTLAEPPMGLSFHSHPKAGDGQYLYAGGSSSRLAHQSGLDPIEAQGYLAREHFRSETKSTSTDEELMHLPAANASSTSSFGPTSPFQMSKPEGSQLQASRAEELEGSFQATRAGTAAIESESQREQNADKQSPAPVRLSLDRLDDKSEK